MDTKKSVISVKDVTKEFKVYYDKGSSLKEKVLFRNRNRYENRKVLDNISFDIYEGEAVGLIGENGCGKSTTLKLLTKIIYPNQGTIAVDGRISSLLELGAGFHPDMSGRENIYTNASIFGLTKKEIENRLDDIIEFSELGEFLDNPVRTYSSGMYMRLAFSVAINVNAKILLIDEILAVGDTNFQTKCFTKLRELKAKGVTIVIVSHDTGTIEKFCNRAIWISHGKIVQNGKAAHVIDSYLSYMNKKRIQSMELEEAKNEIKEKQKEPLEQERSAPPSEPQTEVEVAQIDYNANHFGLGKVEIEEGYLLNQDGKRTTILKTGEDAEIHIYYKVNEPLEEYVFGFGIYTLDGVCILGNNTQIDRIRIKHEGDNGHIKCKINRIPLLDGEYVLNLAVVDSDGTPMDFYRDYCHFHVISEDKSVGICFMDHIWESENKEND